MGKSRRLAAVLVAVVAVCCGVVAAPASAVTSPQLLSVSVSANQVTAPGQVTLSYTASSDTPITMVKVRYTSPDGRHWFVALTAGSAGSGILSVPDGVANGPWTLDSVYLYAGPNDYSDICAQGSPNAASYCTFTDFSAETVTVSGSTPDYDAPLISSMSVTPSSVQPGGQVTASWADDEVHKDGGIRLTFENLDPRAQADTVSFQSAYDEDLSTRQISFPLKQFAYNGIYQLTALEIWDNLGNYATYRADGTTQLSAGTVSPTSHALNFSAISFTVTGSTQGLNPPELTSLHVSPPTAPNTGPIQIGYTATAAASPLDTIRITYLAPAGPEVFFEGGWPLAGTIPFWNSHFGTYRLSEIQLKDDRGQILIYRRDGTTDNPITGVVGHHTLNFPQFDLTIMPPKPKVLEAWTAPQAATVRWDNPSGSGPQVTATRLTVNPGGFSVLLPTNPTVQPTQQYTIPGLRNGVTYTINLEAIGPDNATSGPTQASVTPLMSDHIFSPGDENHDGRDDLLAYTPGGESSIWLYARGGASYVARTMYGAVPQVQRATPAGNNGLFVVHPDGTLEEQVAIGDVFYTQVFGRGWDSMRFLAGGFDFNGSGMPDLYATSSAGNLYLYPVQKTDYGIRILSRQFVGSGWNSMQSVFSPGDFNGDHKADLMAVDGSGNLWLYPGNGHGGFGARVLAGTGWGGFGAVFALRNYSGNGHMDVGAVDMAGNLYRYAGTGTGRFLPGRSLIGTHWDMYF